MEDEQEVMEAESQASPNEDPPTRTTKARKVVPPVKSPRIPPIIIKETGNWNQTRHLMNVNKIKTTKSKLVSTGIQIEPQTEEDHRNLSKTLKSNQIEFYTYQLRSEKKLKVVMRGINDDITEKEIDSQKKYTPLQRSRAWRARTAYQPLLSSSKLVVNTNLFTTLMSAAA